MPGIHSALADLARDRATGALLTDGWGAVYLIDGRVTFAEHPATTRLEDTLTAGGRIPAEAIDRARRAARAGGETLIAEGALTRGELQLCVAGTVLDAAYFLLALPDPHPRFKPGLRHWLGPYRFFDVTGLVTECERRRAQLDRVCPSAELDTLPVRPVVRAPGDRVVLTGAQWEIVVAADGRATPAELARRLGRPVYTVLLAVRLLAAAGLLARPVPPPPAPPAPPPPPAPARKAQPAQAAPILAAPILAAPVQAAPAQAAPAQAAPAQAAPVAPADEPGAPTPAPERLPRRSGGSGPRPGANASPPGEPDGWPAVTGDPADVGLLLRLRNALKELV